MVILSQTSFEPCTDREIDYIGWNEVSVFELAEAISLRMNCQVVAGDQLGNLPA